MASERDRPIWDEYRQTLVDLVREAGAEFLDGEQPAMLADVIAGMTDDELYEGTRLRFGVYLPLPVEGRHRKLASIETTADMKGVFDMSVEDFTEPEEPFRWREEREDDELED